MKVPSSIETAVGSAKSTLFSSIMQTATSIRTQVGNAKSALYSYIEQTVSSLTLSASKIYLDGDTTLGGQMTINSGKLYVQNNLTVASSYQISTKKVAIQADGSITFDDSGGNIGTMTLNVGKVASLITGLKVVSSGNTYKLQSKTVEKPSTWTDIPDTSFSRAVGSFSVGAGNGKINVTANPQNQTESVKVSVGGSNSITTNGTYTYKVYFENADGDDVETGASMNVTVNTGVSAYDYYNTDSINQRTGANKFWKKPTENSGTCTIPNVGNTAAETWFSMSHISITRASWHSVSGTVYKGKLYYWDDDDESYVAVVNANKYWYYSDSNKSGTTTVYY